MVVPARPVPGNPVASDWGDTVHDGVVAMDIQTGVGTIAFANSAISGITTITFPRPFASKPQVFVTPQDTGNITIGLRTPNTGAEATTFNCQGRDSREAALNVTSPFAWLAIGPRA